MRTRQKLIPLLVFVSTLLLVACEKKVPQEDIVLLTPTVKYKVNNVQREWVGNKDYKIAKHPNPVNYQSVHYLYISVEPKEFATLLLVSNTNSNLVVGNYYCVPPITDGTGNFYVARMVLTVTTYSQFSPPQTTQKEYHGELSDVKITSITNGYVSGKFSATLKLRNGTEQIFITDGEFNNYRIES